MKYFVLNLIKVFFNDWFYLIIFIWVANSIMREKIIDWIHDKMIWFENRSWESIWEIERFSEDSYIFDKILKENLDNIKSDK